MSILRAADDTQLTCEACESGYRPALTQGECPVCGVPCADERFRPRELDSRLRANLMLVGAVAVNLLMLAVFAVAVLR